MRSSPVHEQQAALAAAWQAAPRVAVLLPCYNEEAAIGQVVRDFRRALPEAVIYVYDNASSDRTGAVAAAAGAVVVHEPLRSEEHTSELQSLMRISYAVCCLQKQ